jgi:A/G-specific adenine glycosylase
VLASHDGGRLGHGRRKMDRDELAGHDLTHGGHGRPVGYSGASPRARGSRAAWEARTALARWFADRRERYPWRIQPNPYRILVGEVMLHQTQASRVAPAFDRFLPRFPTVQALASATRADVIRAWAGLGYNRRAVALHEAARTIVREHAGRVPSDPEDLLRLPGVGPYTAAAVAALAHGRPVAAIDTNVRRVMARAVLGRDPSETDHRAVARAAAVWLDECEPAGWNQAVMDLGREVCRPVPRCGDCPLIPVCLFVGKGRRSVSLKRRQPAFEGSLRQVRGGIVRTLRSVPAATLASLSRTTGAPLDRVAEAVLALAGDGLVRAGPAALSGRPAGRVGLAGQ